MDDIKLDRIAKSVVATNSRARAFYNHNEKTMFCAAFIGISDGVNDMGKCIIENDVIDAYNHYDFPSDSYRMLYKVEYNVFAYFELFNIEQDDVDGIVEQNKFIPVDDYNGIFKFGGI